MGQKRNKAEICADILRLAKSGARKSHIVYKANLNFEIVEKYLELLRNSSLICSPCEKKIFKTTEKGLKFLDHFEGFHKYVQIHSQLELNVLNSFPTINSEE